MIFTARSAAEVTGGRVVGDPSVAFDTIGDDTRTLTAGEAFAAFHGERSDAAANLARAADAGAVASITDLASPGGPDATLIVVDDVAAAVTALARDRLARHPMRVAAITGSTGKTTTKDFLAAALASRYRVHAAPGSYNAEIGVPLTVLGAPTDTEMLVCEFAARGSGHIAWLCGIARPSLSIVTGIGEAHVGEFGSRDAIASAKAELAHATDPTGLVIVPSDDDYLDLLAGGPAPVLTVGPGGHVCWSEVEMSGDRVRAHVRVAGSSVELDVAAGARPIIRNAAFALAAAVHWGVAPRAAAAALASAPRSHWRKELHVGPRLTVLNDAYNANPTSVAGALRAASEIADGRERWALLGTMAELGEAAPAAHDRIGRLAKALGFRVVAVGPGAERIADAAGGAWVVDAVEAAGIVSATAEPDAVVLVKGSRVAGLEAAAALLLEGVTS